MYDLLKTAEQLTAAFITESRNGGNQLYFSCIPMENKHLSTQLGKKGVGYRKLYIIHDPISGYYEFSKVNNQTTIYLGVTKSAVTAYIVGYGTDKSSIINVEPEESDNESVEAVKEYIIKCFFTLIGYNSNNFYNESDKVIEFKNDLVNSIKTLYGDKVQSDILEELLTVYLK